MAKNFNKNIPIVLIGNLLEFYDLGLFGFLSIIIAPLYFPCNDKISSLLASAGVFAIGFFMRPIGAMVFGYVGDTFGRKICLSNTILLMALPTAMISVLPTYGQIGLLAPISLTLCRFFQGFCVGGEYNSSAIYLLENVNHNKRGFFSSLVIAFSILGFFIASIAASIVTAFPEYSSWSWRLAFLFGSTIGVVGFYLRKNYVKEGLVQFSQTRENTYKGVSENWKNIIVTISIGCLAGTLSLSLVGYITSYLTFVIGLPLQQAALINNVGLGIYIFLLPVFGFLSDLWGHRRIMLCGALLAILLSYPFFYLLSSGYLFSGQAGLAILAAMFLAPMHAYMLSLFPESFRCRGISSSFSIGVGIFGGSAPFISTLLVQSMGVQEAPAFYYILSGIFGLVALALSRPVSTHEKAPINKNVDQFPFFKQPLKAS